MYCEIARLPFAFIIAFDLLAFIKMKFGTSVGQASYSVCLPDKVMYYAVTIRNVSRPQFQHLQLLLR